MAALVQTLPPQTTVTMLSSRPSSPGGYTPQPSQNQSFRGPQMSRYNNTSTTGYRGMPSTGPVAPYAFTSTPQLASTQMGPRQYSAGHTGRSVSAPMVPQVSGTSNASAQRHSLANPATGNASPATTASDADVAPSLTLNLPPSGSLISLNSTNSPKPSPDRYRRNVRRNDTDSGPNRLHSGSAMPSGSGMAAVGQLYNHPSQTNSSPSLSTYQSYRGTTFNANAPARKSSADDMTLSRSQNSDLAARYRRRSVGSIETAGLNHSGDSEDTSSPHPNSFIQTPSQQSNASNVQGPKSSHAHTGSTESAASSKSARSSRPTSARNEPAVPINTPTVSIPMQEGRHINVPSRTTDSSRRNPSPLSRPVNLGTENEREPATTKPATGPTALITSSPAVEQLAAVSQKDAKKSKSKLRRAFSFGSAAELRKATAQHNLEKSAAIQTVSKRNSKYEDELEPEQARIAEKQEAAGLGESIYSGQGHFFTGSTDNLSISSTASSASVMLRKMGKGVKKGTRSLVGLFRPKSVVGVPAADGPVNQGSVAQVSMVTVEAEREKVNVNANPHDQAGGGTGFPKLERNSIDTKLSMDSGTAGSSDTRSRRSIVGGERERAEVLAAVKKGILKRGDSNQQSPKLKTYDFKVPDFNLPQIPHINDSPRSSAPSTPHDEPPRSGHRRTDSITIESNDHDDYFSSMTRFASLDSKNATPLTAQALARNISFSPRIQFHDTWPSGEYDRRGEIATCNRLTPMLAQQIKEELNTFKMEMEVHESSKVYTHFF